MVNNKTYQYKFDSAFPISPELYLESRFQLKTFHSFWNSIF